MGIFSKSDTQKQALNIYHKMRELDKHGKESLQIELGMGSTDLKELEKYVARAANGAVVEDRDYFDMLEIAVIKVSRAEQERKISVDRHANNGMTKEKYFNPERRRWEVGYVEKGKDVYYDPKMKAWVKK